MSRPRPTILQIIPRLDTGGAELSTIEITDAIVRAGGRALVATQGGRLEGLVSEAGGEIVAMPVATKNPLSIWRNGRRLAALIRHESVSLVHARSRAPAWSALLAARGTGIPFVTTYHGAYAERGPIKRAYNSIMARADRVIANSGFTADLIRSRYKTESARIRVIHRGVDLGRFNTTVIAADRLERLRAEWRLQPTERLILQPARLTGWKGQRVLIEAVGRLRGEGRLGNTVVVLAGDDQGRADYRAELAAQAERLGLGSQIRMPGHVADIAAAFMLAHVAVIASIEAEAFGRTSIEAQAMGCPVIATAIGAPPETIIAAGAEGALGAGTGWLVAPGDPAALAGALAAALAVDDDERARLARRARAHVATYFTLEAMKLATLKVYDELLGTALAAELAGSGQPSTLR